MDGSLVVLQKEPWVDHFEAETTGDLRVIFFGVWSEYDPLTLDFRIEHTNAFSEGHQLIEVVVENQCPELRCGFELHLLQERWHPRVVEKLDRLHVENTEDPKCHN